MDYTVPMLKYFSQFLSLKQPCPSGLTTCAFDNGRYPVIRGFTRSSSFRQRSDYIILLLEPRRFGCQSLVSYSLSGQSLNLLLFGAWLLITQSSALFKPSRLGLFHPYAVVSEALRVSQQFTSFFLSPFGSQGASAILRSNFIFIIFIVYCVIERQPYPSS